MTDCETFTEEKHSQNVRGTDVRESYELFEFYLITLRKLCVYMTCMNANPEIPIETFAAF